MKNIQNPKSSIHQTWGKHLDPLFETQTMKDLRQFLKSEIQNQEILYPIPQHIFEAYKIPLSQIKVVLLGQDPYHGEGQAHGLSFSVHKDKTIPPSLKNIYKELQTDLNITPPTHGDLRGWAEQGVMLLNSTLTVRAKSPASHFGKGWEFFTDETIKIISDYANPSVFLLLGKKAQEKSDLINSKKHLILKTSHPSPMGGSCFKGFFGSKIFSKTNKFLEDHQRTPIHWENI